MELTSDLSIPLTSETTPSNYECLVGSRKPEPKGHRRLVGLRKRRAARKAATAPRSPPAFNSNAAGEVAMPKSKRTTGGSRSRKKTANITDRLSVLSTILREMTPNEVLTTQALQAKRTNPRVESRPSHPRVHMSASSHPKIAEALPTTRGGRKKPHVRVGSTSLRSYSTMDAEDEDYVDYPPMDLLHGDISPNITPRRIDWSEPVVPPLPGRPVRKTSGCSATSLSTSSSRSQHKDDHDHHDRRRRHHDKRSVDEHKVSLDGVDTAVPWTPHSPADYERMSEIKVSTSDLGFPRVPPIPDLSSDTTTISTKLSNRKSKTNTNTSNERRVVFKGASSNLIDLSSEQSDEGTKKPNSPGSSKPSHSTNRFVPPMDVIPEMPPTEGDVSSSRHVSAARHTSPSHHETRSPSIKINTQSPISSTPPINSASASPSQTSPPKSRSPLGTNKEEETSPAPRTKFSPSLEDLSPRAGPGSTKDPSHSVARGQHIVKTLYSNLESSLQQLPLLLENLHSKVIAQDFNKIRTFALEHPENVELWCSAFENWNEFADTLLAPRCELQVSDGVMVVDYLPSTVAIALYQRSCLKSLSLDLPVIARRLLIIPHVEEMAHSLVTCLSTREVCSDVSSRISTIISALRELSHSAIVELFARLRGFLNSTAHDAIPPRISQWTLLRFSANSDDVDDFLRYLEEVNLLEPLSKLSLPNFFAACDLLSEELEGLIFDAQISIGGNAGGLALRVQHISALHQYIGQWKARKDGVLNQEHEGLVSPTNHDAGDPFLRSFALAAPEPFQTGMESERLGEFARRLEARVKEMRRLLSLICCQLGVSQDGPVAPISMFMESIRTFVAVLTRAPTPAALVRTPTSPAVSVERKDGKKTWLPTLDQFFNVCSPAINNAPGARERQKQQFKIKQYTVTAPDDETPRIFIIP